MQAADKYDQWLWIILRILFPSSVVELSLSAHGLELLQAPIKFNHSDQKSIITSLAIDQHVRQRRWEYNPDPRVSGDFGLISALLSNTHLSCSPASELKGFKYFSLTLHSSCAHLLGALQQ